MGREKILVVGHDLDSLSRIYLALIHRKFKAEACNNPDEITARLKRFRPVVIILDIDQYKIISKNLKISAIVLVEDHGTTQLNYGDIQLQKPVQIEELIKAVETLV